MPEYGPRPIYKTPPQPGAAGYRVDEGEIVPKIDVFRADLDKLEARMEKRLLYACAVSGAVGALIGFMIFVLVGLFI